ncbi:MAG: hypothetical protein H0X62_12995, partial [Bacteroidetes bacterium]|nr:hypothetical protein [Bacteroidota bacterium]
NADRKKRLLIYFEKDEVTAQLKFMPVSNIIPYNGFSFYRIGYIGERPEELSKAYHKMVELNHKNPREKFRENRETNMNFIRGK